MSDRTADFQDWRAQVEAGLGKSYDSLRWITGDGLEVPPLLRSEDSAALTQGAPATAPVSPTGFAIRELIVAADPRAAAAHARWALQQGADEIEFRCDELCREAMSPGIDLGEESDDDDDPFAIPLPGEGGVAIHTRRDLEATLDRLDLSTTSLWFSAGEGALAVLAWWIRIAKSRRIRPEALRGGVDIDPIDQILARRLRREDDATATSRRTSPQSVFDTLAGVLHFAQRELPGVRPLVLDAQSYHLAGAPAALELGLQLAATVEIARALVTRGIAFDVLTRHASVRMQVSHEMLTEVAKLRALRECWRQLARAFGSKTPTATPHVLGLTSARFRADMVDHEVNLIRSSLAATTASIGGCDSLIVMPHDGSDRMGVHDLARNTGLLLRHESHVGSVTDPLSGSHAIEVLTDSLARRAWQHMQAIESMGGFLAAAQDGRLAAMVADAESARASAFATRRRTLVGINRYADLSREDSETAAMELDDLEAFEEAHVARFEKFLDRRRGDRAEAQLLALRRATTTNLMATALEDGVDELTLEEFCTARWPDRERDVVHRHLLFASTDGAPFEELRISAREHEEPGRPRPRVVVLRLGRSPTVLAKADFARDVLRVGGLEPVDVEWAAEGDEPDLPAARSAIVVCAEDADGLAKLALVRGLATGATLIWAGKPDAAVEAACDFAVHRGVDVVAAIARLHRSLGIVIPEDMDEEDTDNENTADEDAHENE
ncbi:MAG: methylmalonyl-CoA mutase family protein [Planctomycetota bacterium]